MGSHNVSFEGDLQAVSEYCLGAFDCAFTHLHMTLGEAASGKVDAEPFVHSERSIGLRSLIEFYP